MLFPIAHSTAVDTWRKSCGGPDAGRKLLFAEEVCRVDVEDAAHGSGDRE